jgi:protein-arginine deiminase
MSDDSYDVKSSSNDSPSGLDSEVDVRRVVLPCETKATVVITVYYRLTSNTAARVLLPVIPVAHTYNTADNGGDGGNVAYDEATEIVGAVHTFEVEESEFGCIHRFTATYTGQLVVGQAYAGQTAYCAVEIPGVGEYAGEIVLEFDDIVVLYHMHMDYDRNGILDEVWALPPAAWVWGAAGRGAVIVNTGGLDAHAAQRAPLEIRRFTAEPLPEHWQCPASWNATLTVSGHAKVDRYLKIWDVSGDDPVLAIGPAKTTYKIARLDRATLTFTMEAVTFPGPQIVDEEAQAFDGVITVTFTTFKGTTQTRQEVTQIRVAPWMIASHAVAAEVVFVAKTVDNADFVTRLRELATTAGCQLEVVSPRPLDQEAAFMLDRWMQDCMEVGQTNRPHTASAGLHAPLRAPRNGHVQNENVAKLSLYGYTELLRDKTQGMVRSGKILDKSIVHHGVGEQSGTNLNSFGNLEVTPPFEGYPRGRIYYGPSGRAPENGAAKQIDPAVKAFLEAQIVQAPFELDVSWLEVGHVDEILTFVPCGDGDFRILIASPAEAYRLLNAVVNKPAARMLVGRELTRIYPAGEAVQKDNFVCEVTVEDFLANGLPFAPIPTLDPHAPKVAPPVPAQTVRDFNTDMQLKITGVVGQLAAAMGEGVRDKIVRVPVLFLESDAKPDHAGGLTADMPNMLVVNDHCIIPRPFGPVVDNVDIFQKALADVLTDLGLTPHFIDDWNEYHMKCGEVHCGTNTLRTFKYFPWWEHE